MRISETKVVQIVESTPPQLVITDDTTGNEIAFTRTEMDNLLRAIYYFHPHMHGMFESIAMFKPPGEQDARVLPQ